MAVESFSVLLAWWISSETMNENEVDCSCLISLWLLAVDECTPIGPSLPMEEAHPLCRLLFVAVSSPLPVKIDCC